MMTATVSEDIINKALVTYIAKNTRYITHAKVSKKDNIITLKAQFTINESCYLSPGSGHFNAVEAIMCFNQMIYVALLGGIEQKMFDFYQGITPDEFNLHRRKVYLLEFDKIKFKKQIDNHSFNGFLNIEPLHKVGDKIYIRCSFGYGNDEACNSFYGTVNAFIPVLEDKLVV